MPNKSYNTMLSLNPQGREAIKAALGLYTDELKKGIKQMKKVRMPTDDLENEIDFVETLLANVNGEERPAHEQLDWTRHQGGQQFADARPPAEEKWIRDNQKIREELLTVGVDVPLERIQGWTDEMCIDAVAWAGALLAAESRAGNALDVQERDRACKEAEEIDAKRPAFLGGRGDVDEAPTGADEHGNEISAEAVRELDDAHANDTEDGPDFSDFDDVEEDEIEDDDEEDVWRKADGRMEEARNAADELAHGEGRESAGGDSDLVEARFLVEVNEPMTFEETLGALELIASQLDRKGEIAAFEAWKAIVEKVFVLFAAAEYSPYAGARKQLEDEMYYADANGVELAAFVRSHIELAQEQADHGYADVQQTGRALEAIAEGEEPPKPGTRNPIDFECAHCSARRGQPCVDPQGRKIAAGPHKPRMDLVKRSIGESKKSVNAAANAYTDSVLIHIFGKTSLELRQRAIKNRVIDPTAKWVREQLGLAPATSAAAPEQQHAQA